MLRRFDVLAFGATSRRSATRAIQAAVDAAAEQGGIVTFPPGRYQSGSIRLRSGVTIELCAGVTLQASRRAADFFPPETLEYASHADDETTYFQPALFYGLDLADIAFIGAGTIDGQGWKRGGPKLIALKRCHRVRMRGITLRRSPNYAVSLLGCHDVEINGLCIRSGFVDGIVVDCCRTVTISRCDVESCNDAICLKSSMALGRAGATVGVRITRCTLATTRSALKFGSESSGDIRQVRIDRCIVRDGTAVLGQAAEAGLALHALDGGTMTDIAVTGLVLTNTRVPVFLRIGNRGRGASGRCAGQIRSIRCTRLTATGADTAAFLSGLPEQAISHVRLAKIEVSLRGGGTARRRRVPQAPTRYLRPPAFGPLPACGIFARHVRRLTLDDVQLRLEKPDGRPVVVTEHVSVSSAQRKSRGAALPQTCSGNL
jgi:polygalacturonase